MTVSAAYIKSIIRSVEPGRPTEKKFGPHVLTIVLMISYDERVKNRQCQKRPTNIRVKIF